MVTMQQQQFWFSGDIDIDWRIDDHTRLVGRQGIAAAREALDNCKESVEMAEAA
jgi:hypothetical protein